MNSPTTVFLVEIARAGLEAVWEYIGLHVLTCLVPAFLLAGAMVSFINKEAIIASLGAGSSKPASFAMATGASFFIAACSCTVIPVASGIYFSGAGIGAAFILLWVAPASNVLSLIYTGNILGAEMIWARVITAVAMAAVIGTIMALVFRREESQRLGAEEERGQKVILGRKDLVLLGLLVLSLLAPNYLVQEGPYSRKVAVWLVATVVAAAYALYTKTPIRTPWLVGGNLVVHKAHFPPASLGSVRCGDYRRRAAALLD